MTALLQGGICSRKWVLSQILGDGGFMDLASWVSSRPDGVPATTPLIPARHLCRCITKLLLDVGFVNVSARSQASPQTMPGEQRKAIFLGQLAAYTSDQYSLLYEASNVFIGQACIKRAGLIARSAANLDLAPTSFATQEHHRAIVFYLHPAAAVGGIVLAVVKAD
jgi:hypothetical protein